MVNSNLVMIVKHGNDMFRIPLMASDIVEKTVAEIIEIALLLRSIGITRTPPPFDEKLQLVGDIINTKRSIKARLFKNGGGIGAASGYFTNNDEIFLANGLGKLMDCRCEKSHRSRFHMLDRVEPKTVNIGISYPETVDIGKRAQRS